MTNIAQLPTTIGGTLPVTTNSDLRTVLQFTWPAGSAHAGQPLDLTGISFRAQCRLSTGDNRMLFDASTDNCLLVLAAQLGQVAFAVPRDAPTAADAPPWHTSNLPPNETALMDIVAMGDGQIINLCQESATGPIQMPITTGVTRNQAASV